MFKGYKGRCCADDDGDGGGGEWDARRGDAQNLRLHESGGMRLEGERESKRV